MLFAHAYGGTGSDAGRVVATGTDASVYLGTVFQGSVDFGGGPTANDGASIGLIHYSAAGNYLGSFHAGNVTGNNDIQAVAVDASGNSYIGGTFYGTLNFGGTCGSITSSPTVTGFANNLYLAKLSPAQQCVWVKQYGIGVGCWVYAIAVDHAGNVLAAGSIWGSCVDFTAPPTNVNCSASPCATNVGDTASCRRDTVQNDAFVLKMDTNGGFQWIRWFTNNADDFGYAIAVDSANNPVLAGTFSGTEDFGNGTQTSTSPLGGYIVKLSAANGNSVWSRPLSYAKPQGIAVDASDSVVVSGSFQATSDFGGGPVTGVGAVKPFLVKYTSANSFVWLQTPQLSAPGLQASGARVATDTSGNVAWTGYYGGPSLAFGGGMNATTTATYGAWVSKHVSATGAPVWVQSLGTTAQNQGFGVATDASLNSWATGYFSGSMPVDGTTLNSTGGTDVYLIKLRP